MDEIIPKTTEVLDQLAALLLKLSPENYSRSLSCLQDNSLGKHVRHIVEFFECLLEGAHIQAVNYDLRRRDLRLENEPSYAMERIARLQNDISLLKDGDFRMQADFGNGVREYKSTIYRELAFCMDHGIHHLALIRVGMQQHFPEIRMNEEMGVAFSTRRYLQEQSGKCVR